MTRAVVAEKPSVARDIAGVLGASQRGEGHFHGNGYVVTWAIGHLVALALQLGRQVVTNRTARDRRWARGSQGSAWPWDRLWASYPP